MNCRPPNILLIMADLWRADYIGALENGKCATPQLDRIAQRGCLFTRAVTPNPICQPARAALLTGRYPHQINQTAMNGDLRPDIATAPQALQRDDLVTDQPLTANQKRALWANRRRYRAMIACIDGWIGRLLAALDQRGERPAQH